MRWIILFLALFAAGIAFILYVVASIPDGKLLGVSFLAIGIANSLLYKVTARKMFTRTQSSPPFIARVWLVSGEKGLQILYLGIGIILAAAGCLELVIGCLSSPH